MIISLTGFMGCGKSSVGRKLSELLSCSFVDLDSVIEERTGHSIPEIFAAEGEDAFRLVEKGTLEYILEMPVPRQSDKEHLSGKEGLMVLALGGGTIMTGKCAELVHEKTTCIYLRATVDTLVGNLSDESDGRPMLNTDSSLRLRIEELMNLRSDTYEKTAHIIVDTDGRSIEAITDEIRHLLTLRQL